MHFLLTCSTDQEGELREVGGGRESFTHYCDSLTIEKGSKKDTSTQNGLQNTFPNNGRRLFADAY